MLGRSGVWWNKFLGSATRIWPAKIRIFRRGHGFARDNWITGDSWSDAEFMFHAWKGSDYNSSPFKVRNLSNFYFQKPFNISECGQGFSGWNWKKEKHVSIEDERKKLDQYEQGQRKDFPKEARIIPYLSEPEIGECYPKCDEET